MRSALVHEYGRARGFEHDARDRVDAILALAVEFLQDAENGGFRERPPVLRQFFEALVDLPLKPCLLQVHVALVRRVERLIRLPMDPCLDLLQRIAVLKDGAPIRSDLVFERIDLDFAVDALQEL